MSFPFIDDVEEMVFVDGLDERIKISNFEEIKLGIFGIAFGSPMDFKLGVSFEYDFRDFFYRFDGSDQGRFRDQSEQKLIGYTKDSFLRKNPTRFDDNEFYYFFL